LEKSEEYEGENVTFGKNLEDCVICGGSSNGCDFRGNEPLERFDAEHFCRSSNQFLASAGAFAAEQTIVRWFPGV
jgi:hypothetical protein